MKSFNLLSPPQAEKDICLIAAHLDLAGSAGVAPLAASCRAEAKLY